MYNIPQVIYGLTYWHNIIQLWEGVQWAWKILERGFSGCTIFRLNLVTLTTFLMPLIQALHLEKRTLRPHLNNFTNSGHTKHWERLGAHREQIRCVTESNIELGVLTAWYVKMCKCGGGMQRWCKIQLLLMKEIFEKPLTLEYLLMV